MPPEALERVVDGSMTKRARGLSAFEVQTLNPLVLGAARLMSSHQIVVLIGVLHDEIRRRREAASAHWATLRPLL